MIIFTTLPNTYETFLTADFMKKLYTFLLLAITMAASSQTITFTDQNLRVELINAGPFNSTARNANGDFINIDTNNDNQIQVSEALLVWQLNLQGNNVTDMGGIKFFENLHILNMAYSDLVSGDFAGMVNLEVLNLMNSNGPTNYVNVSGCTALREFVCYSTELTSLDLSNLPALETVLCYQNDLTSINLSGSSNLKTLKIGSNMLLPTVDFTGLVNLEVLDLGSCYMTSLDLSGLSGLKEFTCYAYELNEIDLSNLTNLISADCKYGEMTSINLSGCSSIETFIAEQSSLVNLNLSGLSSIKIINCYDSMLESIDASGLSTLEELKLGQNNLSTVNVSGATSLKKLDLYSNQLSSLSVAGLTELTDLSIGYNLEISELDISDCSKLKYFSCGDTAISAIDVRHCHNLVQIACGNMPNLQSLFIKNGTEETIFLYNDPSLAYICADISDTQSLNSLNIPVTCVINSYCSFVPGGVFYNGIGDVNIEANSGGCESSVLGLAGGMLKVSNDTDVHYVYADNMGSYTFPAGTGTYTVLPILENGYFSVTPTVGTISLSETQTVSVQDFCLTPIGEMSDIEVVLLPITPARPGFDAQYKITYRNKGNVTQSGTVVLNFMDDRIDYETASPSPINIELGLLTWDYDALAPFEARNIFVTLNINSPMEIPAVDIDDQLDFGAYVYLNGNDVNLADNDFGLKQVVVGSFDPNDKTCLEGSVVAVDDVGEYVHYIIRFENIGTFAAENVVVSDVIDTSKFDIETLMPISASHTYFARIADGNKAEFIFENINLPYDDASNDGYISFKIKTLPTLSVGETFSNTASIYFDYNWPIITNDAVTTIQLLELSDFDFENFIRIYPNPTIDILNIDVLDTLQINSLQIFDAVGRIIVNHMDDSLQIDVSRLQQGHYYLKVNCDRGSSITKFIKQ